MAIYYGNGSLTPSSSTLAHDVRRAWKSAFDSAIAAGKTQWSVTEHDFVASGATTQRTTITNSSGFVLVLTTSTTDATTTINAWVGGGYSTPNITQLGMGIVGAAAGGPYTTDANGISTTTYNPNAPQTGTISSHNAIFFSATGAQSAWTAHIETNYAVLTFNDGSATKGKWLYVGAIDSLVTNSAITNQTKMFVCSSGNGAGAIVQSAGNYSQTISSSGFRPGLQTWSGAWDGAPAFAAQIDKYSTNPTQANVSPVYLTRQTNDITVLDATGSATSFGWLTGKLKGVFHAAAASANYGDTISVSGSTYMYVGGTSYNTSNSVAGWALTS
jgi:hypothetical protein